MAVLAQRAKLLLVLVLLLMTAQTVPWRVLVPRTLVTSLASGGPMTARQRETRQTVVKLFNFP